MIKNISVGDQFELDVESIAFGGAGVSRSLGLVCFIPFAAPGDKLLIQISNVKKTFCEAEIVKILIPSLDRVQPKCPVYGECGGCNLQHLNYQAQLEVKEKILKDHIGKALKLQNLPFEAIVASPDQFSYRNRIQIKTSAGKKGYFARKSHQIVDIASCPIAERELNDLLRSIQANNEPSLKKYSIKKTLDGKAKVSVMNEDDEPIGFSQVNSKQNQNLIQFVVDEFASQKFELICDLYGGSGNFAFPLSERTQIPIHSVELNEEASLFGKSLDKQAKFVQFFHCDVETYLKVFQRPKTFGVLLDPPRNGCSKEVVEYLAEQSPDQIVYVSCDPATLARDLGLFLKCSDAIGVKYQIKRIIPIDMFPQTDHIESLVSLKKL